MKKRKSFEPGSSTFEYDKVDGAYKKDIDRFADVSDVDADKKKTK